MILTIKMDSASSNTLREPKFAKLDNYKLNFENVLGYAIRF